MSQPAEPRVLVADDEPDIVDVVTMALRFQGFAVESAGNGGEASTPCPTSGPTSSSLDGGAVVLGDAYRLPQVFANLLRNALVHTPIEVGVGSSGASVRMDMRDRGPGLRDGDPAALFERFWRAEGGRGRGKAGAGLGLAIVAAIVDAHGGRCRLLMLWTVAPRSWRC
jgi:two-component system OmpR family sensor kinase